MTVTYSLEVFRLFEVSRARFWGFPKLLARWRGSIYRLLYREMLVFLGVHYFVALTYRHGMQASAQRQFERIAVYCRDFTSVVPITFVLGFYVAFVLGRWWQQYMAIPWPDRVAMQISAYVKGTDIRARMMRRAMARYLNLLTVLTFQSTSTVIKRRFPTIEHMKMAGILTQEELYELAHTHTPHGNWWVPAQWFCQLAMKARQENRITDDYQLRALIQASDIIASLSRKSLQEAMDFRGLCGLVWSYDWISVPLVVTVAVYSFFIACLFGRQYLLETPIESLSVSKSGESTGQPSGHAIDFYAPVFTVFQFFFYVGWLKIAESVLNPFGEDDDDFDMNWIIDRNMQVCYQIVDQMHGRFPTLSRDDHWFSESVQVPYTQGAANYKATPFFGSATSLDIPPKDAEWMRSFSPISEESHSSVAAIMRRMQSTPAGVVGARVGLGSRILPLARQLQSAIALRYNRARSPVKTTAESSTLKADGDVNRDLGIGLMKQRLFRHNLLVRASTEMCESGGLDQHWSPSSAGSWAVVADLDVDDCEELSYDTVSYRQLTTSTSPVRDKVGGFIGDLARGEIRVDSSRTLRLPSTVAEEDEESIESDVEMEHSGYPGYGASSLRARRVTVEVYVNDELRQAEGDDGQGEVVGMAEGSRAPLLPPADE